MQLICIYAALDGLDFKVVERIECITRVERYFNDNALCK